MQCGALCALRKVAYHMKHSSFLNAKSITLVALFAALSALGAFIRVPMGLISFTLQTFFVTLAGLLLGPRLGALSVGIYVLIGLLGVPVFTQGGGPAYVLQPTFGYLLGFVLCAWLVGKLTQGEKCSFSALFAASCAGLAVVYALGMLYFALITTVYLGAPRPAQTILIYCCLIFLPGDLLSCTLACLIRKKLPRSVCSVPR